MWIFFDTLPKEHCVFFLILSVFAFAAFVVMIIVALIFRKPAFFVASLSPLLMYYFYLLYYSMCVNSLK